MTEDKKNLHIKPTKEELEADIQKTAEEAEALKGKKPEEQEEEPPKPKTKKSKPSLAPQEPVKPKSKPEPTPLEEEEPDYKKKFIASTKEAQILHSKNKKTNQAIAQAMEVPEPTEEELKKEYPDWDMMSDFEKKMAKDSLVNSRRFQALEGIVQENKDLESWQKKVDDFVDNPQAFIDYPGLEGKEEEFRLFATKPTRRNLDFPDLVSAFLYDETKKMKPKQKSKMFEAGSAGPNEPLTPKSDKISIEEARKLRETDYGKYREYLKAGKISSEV